MKESTLNESFGQVSAKTETPKILDCFWCQSKQRTPIAIRKDGMTVYSCQNCKLNSVAHINFDLTEMYNGSEYFESQNEYGYNSYETAGIEHWFECLFAVLLLAEDLNTPNILDLGCATGSFLDHCKHFGFETCGMELSEWARNKCSSRGHRMVATTLDDLNPNEDFEILTAFHLLEHLERPREFLTKIAERVCGGSKFFATFPYVDFNEVNWSGIDSSFEHISFFNPAFVSTNFPSIFKNKFYCVGGIGQIYCFAGNFSDSTERAINLACQIVNHDSELSPQKLFEESNGLSILGLVFLTTFVARNHSASRAACILESLESKFSNKSDKDWILLCKALIHLQNGNIFGTASFLEKVSTKNPAIAKLRGELKSRLNKMPLQNSNARISIILYGCVDSEVREHFFHSIGSQTYPNIEIIHTVEREDCRCRTPKYYRDLIKYESSSSIKRGFWNGIKESASGDIFLWTDGSMVMSPYCLYALYELLQSDPQNIVIPKTESKHYFGKRTIENLLGTQVKTIPPLILLSKNNELLNIISPEIIEDKNSLQTIRKKVKVSITKDTLAWPRRVTDTA